MKNPPSPLYKGEPRQKEDVMNDKSVGGVHWSFWVIGCSSLISYSKQAESKGWIR